jgi:hypothetical protein
MKSFLTILALVAVAVMPLSSAVSDDSNPGWTWSDEYSGRAALANYIGGALWTNAVDVVVDGDYAYCSFRNGLVVLDITNPDQTFFVSKLFLMGYGSGLAKQDNYIYFTAGAYGLYVVDVTNPADPVLVNRYDPLGSVRMDNVFVQDSLVFIADDGYGLRILNMIDPLNPIDVSEYNNIGITGCQDIVVRDDIAYALFAQSGAGINSGVFTINIANPAFPTLLGQSGGVPWGQSLALFDTLAFAGSSFGLKVVDISNPSSPAVIGSSPRGRYGIAATATEVYVTDAHNGMFVYDVTDPIVPDSIGNYPSFGMAQGVFKSGNSLYMAEQRGIHRIDISTPSDPQQLDYFDTPATLRSLAVKGNLAFVASSETGLRIVDISDPLNPYEAGSFVTLARMNDAVVSGGLVYTVDDTGLVAFEVVDPASPTVVGFWEIGEGPYYVLCVQDTVACLGGPIDVTLVNVGDPSAPIFIGDWSGSGTIYSIASYNGLVYVGSDAGLYIVDITDPTSPTTIGSWPTAEEAYSMGFQDNLVYIGTYGGLLVLDISDPTTPDSVGILPGDVPADDIFVGDTVLYTVNEDSGLTVVNIADPVNPIYVGKIATPSEAIAVYARDTTVFVTTSYALMVFETPFGVPTAVEDGSRPIPEHIELSQNYPNPFNPATTIEYAVPRTSRVTLELFDITGRKVTTLVDRTQRIGSHRVTWDGTNSSGDRVATGVYFYRLTIGDIVDTKKMVLLK